MNTDQAERLASAGDIARYALSALLLLAGLAGYYWFSGWPGPLRGLLPVLGAVAALGVFAFTSKGLQAREFLAEAQFELRKVVWPTKQEALRSTGVILLVVVIISLLLALMDFGISNVISRLLG